MSEGTTVSQTSILLPTAGVDLFIRDKETIESARALDDDWRFARVTISIEEGDVETAIQSYQQTSSPALIIIETDSTDDSFAERLEALSEHCDEGTNAIVIGPDNDVELYRKLTSMGVSDYLVRPVAKDTLSEAIAKTLIEQLGTIGSRLIGLIGAKGGVGVSSLTQALAWGISDKTSQKTLVLDAAGGWSTLGVGFGYDSLSTLHEAVRAGSNKDHDTLKRMLFEASDKLHVLASGNESMLEASVHAQQYEELLDMVMATYPIVIVDLSGSIPSLKRMVINRAHELLLITTPTLPSLRSARTMMQEIKDLQGGAIQGLDLIINMKGLSPGKEVSEKDIGSALEYTPSAVIPFDPKLFVGSENEGKKITEESNGSKIVEVLMPLAEKVMERKLTGDEGAQNKTGIFNQIVDKIVKK